MSDLERLIRQIVRDEISRAVANGNNSRARSLIGIGARGHGDPECESEETERMDPTSTATSSELLSSEPTASELLQRLRAKPLRESASTKSTRKRSGER